MSQKCTLLSSLTIEIRQLCKYSPLKGSVQNLYCYGFRDRINFYLFFSDITLKVPRKTRNNGTLFMHAVLLDDSRLYKEFDELARTESIHTLPLVTHTEPQAVTFNLLQQNVSYLVFIHFFISMLSIM